MKLEFHVGDKSYTNDYEKSSKITPNMCEEWINYPIVLESFVNDKNGVYFKYYYPYYEHNFETGDTRSFTEIPISIAILNNRAYEVDCLFGTAEYSCLLTDILEKEGIL